MYNILVLHRIHTVLNICEGFTIYNMRDLNLHCPTKGGEEHYWVFSMEIQVCCGQVPVDGARTECQAIVPDAESGGPQELRCKVWEQL